MKKLFNLQLFADETNQVMTTDLEPAISIDVANTLKENIESLMTVLGINEKTAMGVGTVLKVYKTAVKELAEQVEEGKDIALSKVERKLVKSIEMTLKKWRKQTTAEAIQKVGQATAINGTDDVIIRAVQKAIRDDFYTNLEVGTGTATGAGLQAALAAGWGAIQKAFADYDATPIYFVNVDDVADYLGQANVTVQSAFGMSYIDNFLGLGTVVLAPSLAKGKFYATAKENLHMAYIPMGTGDVANAFSLTSDETGLVGVTHNAVSTNASIDSLFMSGVVFFPEVADCVIKGTISAKA